jgi:hypothetical protein
MTPHSLEELFWHRPWLSKKAPTAWGCSFAKDMAARAHWKNWKPSRKQQEIMRGMVAETFRTTGFELIER